MTPPEAFLLGYAAAMLTVAMVAFLAMVVGGRK